MPKRKALIMFMVVAASFALFAYTSTNTEASGGLPPDCVVLKGIGICPAENFYTTSESDNGNTNVTFNWTWQKVYGVGRTKFFDILGPDNIDPGICYGFFGNRNCSNVEITYNGRRVGNSVYRSGAGAPEPSRFAAGIKDKNVFRAHIFRFVPRYPVNFSITFKNQEEPPPPGTTYGQLTRKSFFKFESDRLRGPGERTFDNVFQSSNEVVTTEPGQGFCPDFQNNKIFDCRDLETPLEGKPIVEIEVSGEGITCPDNILAAVKNKVLVKLEGSTCYVYLYNGAYYSICY